MFRRATLLGLVALVALAGPALAGTTANITITVTVEFLSVNVTPTTVALGTVAAGTTTISTKLDILNDGNVAENVGLSITNQSAPVGWIAGATPGPDTYVLYAVIVTDGGPAPNAGNCGANDVLTASALYWANTDGTATNSLLGPVGTATPVAAAGAKDLYFGFAAPTTVSSAVQHSITVELSVAKD